MLEAAFAKLEAAQRRERRKLHSRLLPKAEACLREATEKVYKTNDAVDAAVAVCSLDAPADRLILDAIAKSSEILGSSMSSSRSSVLISDTSSSSYNSSDILGASTSSSRSLVLTGHTSSDPCDKHQSQQPVPSSSTAPVDLDGAVAGDDGETLVDVFDEPEGQTERYNRNYCRSLRLAMGDKYIPLTSNEWYEENGISDDREEEGVQTEMLIRAENDGYGIENPDDPVAIDNIDLRNAKLCMFNLAAEPIVLTRQIEASMTVRTLILSCSGNADV